MSRSDTSLVLGLLFFIASKEASTAVAVLLLTTGAVFEVVASMFYLWKDKR